MALASVLAGLLTVFAAAEPAGAATRVAGEKAHPSELLAVTARTKPTSRPLSTALRSHLATASSHPTPPFTECPAIGADTSCGILIDVTNGGQSVYADSSQGPFDGTEDTLVGVVNDSSSTLTSLALAGSSSIMGFDGDGLCGGYSGSPSCC